MPSSTAAAAEPPPEEPTTSRENTSTPSGFASSFTASTLSKEALPVFSLP